MQDAHIPTDAGLAPSHVIPVVVDVPGAEAGAETVPPAPHFFPGTEPIDAVVAPEALPEPATEEPGKPSWAERRAARKAARPEGESPQRRGLPWDTRVKIAIVLSFVVLVAVLVTNRMRGKAKDGPGTPTNSIKGPQSASLGSKKGPKDAGPKKDGKPATVPVEKATSDSPPEPDAEDGPRRPSAPPSDAGTIEKVSSPPAVPAEDAPPSIGDAGKPRKEETGEEPANPPAPGGEMPLLPEGKAGAEQPPTTAEASSPPVISPSPNDAKAAQGNPAPESASPPSVDTPPTIAQDTPTGNPPATPVETPKPGAEVPSSEELKATPPAAPADTNPPPSTPSTPPPADTNPPTSMPSTPLPPNGNALPEVGHSPSGLPPGEMPKSEPAQAAPPVSPSEPALPAAGTAPEVPASKPANVPVFSTPPSAEPSGSPAPAASADPLPPGGGFPLPNAGLSRTAATSRRASGTAVPISDRSAATAAEVPAAAAGPEDEAVHVVRRGENFWTISRYHYASGRFYRALWYANRDVARSPEDLYVGTAIRIPPLEALNREYIDPPRTARADGNPSARLAAPAAGPRRDLSAARASATGGAEGYGLPLAKNVPERTLRRAVSPAHRVYVVRGRNETLRSIARDQLGDSEREEEIYRLNRDTLDGDGYRLQVGMSLKIPNEPRR